MGEGGGQGLRVLGEEDRGDEGGPAEFAEFGEGVDDVEGCGPGFVGRVVGRAGLDVFGASLHDEAAVVGGEAVAVEDEGVEELAAGEGHEHPAAEPPRPLAVGRFPEVTTGFESVVAEFEAAGEEVDGDFGA